MSIDEPDAKATWNPFGNRFSPMSQVHFCLLYSIRKAIIILGFRPPKWFLFSSRIRLQAWRWGKKKNPVFFLFRLAQVSCIISSSIFSNQGERFQKKRKKTLETSFLFEWFVADDAVQPVRCRNVSRVQHLNLINGRWSLLQVALFF